MKKVLNILLLLVFVFTLSSCTALEEYADNIRPTTYAPALTESEAGFIEMLPELKLAGIAVSNTAIFQDESQTRKGSGVIIKKEDGRLNTVYYALTTQWVVQNSLNVTIFTENGTSISAQVLNSKISYEADEDIALIRFSSSEDLHVVELKRIDDALSLDSLTIFSVATPISTAYLNFVTNPALIMGVYDNRIVHGTNLNPGTLGSPLYLKSTGELIGINVKYSFTAGGRPEVLINEAIHINRVIDLVEGYL
ncbi:S1 family peptidase [Acholeplasma laidlawii]|uniref:S1 family peptidase n=1 Tax=Acholeplasma laidlawii TaxID=2148 RepID=UPI003F905732